MWKTKTHTFRLYLVLCLVVFFAALLLPACTPDAPAEEPVVTPTVVLTVTPTVVPTVTLTVEPVDEPADEPTTEPTIEVDINEKINDFFVPDKILFTGVPADIVKTIDLVNQVTPTLKVDLEQNWSIDNLRPLPGFDEEPLFSIRQYSLSNDQLNVLEIISKTIALVEDYEEQNDVQLAVFPEPVFRIGVRADIIGQGGGNSPGIEGAPGGGSAGIEGAPGGGLGNVPDYFQSQWAFKTASSDSTSINLMGGVTGKDVQVLVFDSLPLGRDECADAEDPRGYEVNFCADNTIGSVASEPGSVNEHGYFVASLVQAVAPESQIDIIQVLEPTEDGEDVVGTLGYLLHMMDIKLSDSAFVVSDSVVINLSLGLKLNSIEDGGPDNDPFRSALLTLCTSTNNRLPSIIESENAQDPCPPAGPIPSVALQVYIEHVTKELGYLVVASAGNERGDSSAAQPPALLPAGLAGVIGVGGSNYNGESSCFSNQGDVYAPSGNGYDGTEFDEPACHVDIVKQCYEGEESWSDGLHGGCPSAVIGRVYNTGDNYGSGFAYWAGTSFSAPMVSGLAALIWDVNSTLTVPEVIELIKTCSNNGIINVQRTVETAQEGKTSCVAQ